VLLGGLAVIGLGLAVAAAPVTNQGLTVGRPPGLAYYLVNDDPAVTDLRARRQGRLVELVVADCMKRLAFPYTPVSPPQAYADAGLPPREWAAKYGFGYTTQMDSPPTEDRDPNFEYQSTLSPTEQSRYRTALFGDGTSTNGGCRTLAEARVIKPRTIALESVRDLVSELSATRATDLRLNQAETQWSNCARAAGMPTGRLEARGVAQTLFANRLSQIELPQGGYDQAKLAALQEEERRVAVALFECDQKYAAESEPIVKELEAAWVRRHEIELRSVRQQLLAIDEDLAKLALEYDVN
jgi:hypothetical protein